MAKKLLGTRINVWVEPAFYQKMKVQAALENVTLKDWVIEALKKRLKQQ